MNDRGRPRITHDPATPGPVRDLVGYGAHTPPVTWPDGAAVALNVVVNYEEGSERSHPAGDACNEGLGEIPYPFPPDQRDLSVESVYEYGSRAGIWRLMRIFSDCDVRVTFFAAATALARNPEVAAALTEGGHEPCSHGWRWSEHWQLDESEERERIRWAVELIRDLCGERPLGWYCRYAPGPNTRALLVSEGGFLYDADSYNDDLPYYVAVDGRNHLVVPYSLATNDGGFVRPVGVSSPSDYVDRQRRALDELRREGHAGRPKMMSVGLHPRWSGQAGRANAVREFLEYAVACGDVWITRRCEIARWWLATVPPG